MRAAGLILRGVEFAGWSIELADASWHQPLTFKLGGAVVWALPDRWQVADLVDGEYLNRRGMLGRSLADTLRAVADEQACPF